MNIQDYEMRAARAPARVNCAICTLKNALVSRKVAVVNVKSYCFNAAALNTNEIEINPDALYFHDHVKNMQNT